jgi:hypothetical protein
MYDWRQVSCDICGSSIIPLPIPFGIVRLLSFRLDTDILFGIHGGFRTIVVLTGKRCQGSRLFQTWEQDFLLLTRLSLFWFPHALGVTTISTLRSMGSQYKPEFCLPSLGYLYRLCCGNS